MGDASTETVAGARAETAGTRAQVRADAGAETVGTRAQTGADAGTETAGTRMDGPGGQPASRDCRALAGEAAAAWRAAVATPLHPPGCGCCGASPIKLDPSWLAEDIDWALRARYAAAGAGELIALLDGHRRPPDEDFTLRIAALAAHGERERDGAAARILRDLADMLYTVGGLRSRAREV